MIKLTKIAVFAATCSLALTAIATAGELTIATVNNGHMIEMQKFSSHFEKANPDIKLKWVTLEEGVLRQRVTTDISTRGIERVIAFLTFMTALDKYPEKAILSSLKLEQKSGNKHYDKIGKIVDHSVKRYNEDLSVADAASMAGMSETSFSRNFRSSTSNRFTDFINQVRIGHACLLLQETDARISSICFDVGFQNLANFNRHFFKMKNITPSGYRKTARSKLQLPANHERGLHS